MEDENRVGCAGRIVNILTAAIVFVALIAAIVLAVAFFSPNLAASLFPQEATSTPLPTAVPPTAAAVAEVPSNTPTATEDPLIPTFTPAFTETPVPATATNTRQPTLTPSVTNTFPPPTPTRTPSSTPTPTPSPGPSPTATNTLSPFPFTKSPDSPLYLRNFANTAGCDWLGIAGEVLDTNGNPVTGGQYRVHVWDSGVDSRLDTGTAGSYGPSGWEQFVLDAPEIRSYNLQLETTNGTAVSQVYRVQTRASCNENLLYFIFTQNR
jgi:hypothetical protein